MAVNPATSLTVARIVGALQLTWTDSTTIGATHTVYRSKGSCGTFVVIATNIGTRYTDFNVANGEVYSYYVVAMLGFTTSAPTAVVSETYVGAADQYSATLRSSDALTDRKGAVVTYSGVVEAGCGEYQRLQRLRGKATLCGK